MYPKLINLGMENVLTCLRNEYRVHGISTFHFLGVLLMTYPEGNLSILSLY